MMTNETMTSESREVHVWYHCHHCGAAPIEGKRYHCDTCPAGPDNDLCEACRQLLDQGKIKHPAENSFAASLPNREHRFSLLDGKPAHLFEPWLKVPHPTTPAPELPSPFVVRPVFNAGADSVIGGYGFVATTGHDDDSSHNPTPVFLTALHVMDELIKKLGVDCSVTNKDYSGRELPEKVTGVDFFDVFAPNWMAAPLGTAAPMLVLPDARTDDEEPYSHRDIAAFRLSGNSGAAAARLAKEPPAVGDALWLVAQRAPGNPARHLFQAVVVERTDRSLVFKYRNPQEEPKYTSGAPLVNNAGEVVGIIVGGGRFGGEKFGHANHVTNIRRHLGDAPG